jgi:hypothetical protein
VRFFRAHGIDVSIAVALLVAALVAGARDSASRAQTPAGTAVRLGWERASRDAIGHGQPPLWNPLYFGGQPLAGNPDAAALYPPHLALRLLPIESFVEASFVLHTWLLAFGAYLLIVALGETRLSAALMAVATMAVGALAAPAFSASASLPAVAWLPLLAAACVFAARRQTRRPGGLLVFALSCVMLGQGTRGVWYALATVVAVYGWFIVWATGDGHTRRALGAQGGLAIAAAVGLTAFQVVPSLWLAAERSRGSLLHAVEAEHAGQAPAPPQVRQVLARIGAHRTLSTCTSVTDADLAAAGVPAVGGMSYYPPAYTRITSLASGAYPAKDGRYEPIATAGSSAARQDLLAWLGVEYLVACAPPDLAQWQEVDRAGSIGVYRAALPPLQAMWTCMPVAMTRQQVEHALATRVYDSHLQLAGQRAIVHVRWANGVTDAQRQAAERAGHLVPIRFIGTRTWQYVLEDTSEPNVRALVSDPGVEDTAHISRTLAVEGPPAPDPDQQPKSEWLIGATPCPAARVVDAQRSRPALGRTVVQVSAPRDGVVVLPRIAVPGLVARVDGRRVTPMRVNLAFVAIPVDAGPHRVEVSYLPAAQLAGIGVSLVTMAIAGVYGWRSRTRR